MKLKTISVDSHIVVKLSDLIHKELKQKYNLFSPCEVVAAIAAQMFLFERKEVYIIQSSLHSVLYDGKDTWDFVLGIVLRDYKYPSKKYSELEYIPLFDNSKDLPNDFKDFFKRYYIDDVSEKISITKVKGMGLFHGTKEKEIRSKTY